MTGYPNGAIPSEESDNIASLERSPMWVKAAGVAVLLVAIAAIIAMALGAADHGPGQAVGL